MLNTTFQGMGNYAEESECPGYGRGGSGGRWAHIVHLIYFLISLAVAFVFSEQGSSWLFTNWEAWSVYVGVDCGNIQPVLPSASHSSLGGAFSKLSSTKEERAAPVLLKEAGANTFFHINVAIYKQNQGSGWGGWLRLPFSAYPHRVPRLVTLSSLEQLYFLDLSKVRKT